MMRRLFRILLRLLPADFRGDFADAMSADMDAGGRRGIAFWWREIGSLLGALIREHVNALRDDVKYALRMMRRTPGFTSMAVLMLALGTGVNVAMFSIVDAVLLRSPFERPEELLEVDMLVKGQRTLVPVDRYRGLTTAPGPLVSVGAFTSGSHVLTGHGDPLNVDDIECVSASMFDVLRVRPSIGRSFSSAEDSPGADPTIVLSYEFWRQLGGSRDILGTPITINQTAVTVIGVMPKGFAGPLARGDVQGWMPISRPVRSAENAGCREGAVSVVGRRNSDVSRDAVAASLSGFAVVPLESPVMGDVRTPFIVLMAAVACVLLIACFNVGGLQMERTLARRREMALRLALGASRGRLARQTLTENLLFSLAGALAGIAATALTLESIVSMLPSNVPYLEQIVVNGRVLAMAIGVAAAVGVLAGLLPIGETRRVSPARDLTDTARASERRSGWGRRALVVAEIALSIVVLIGAALMVQTFLTLRPTRPGFDPANKLVMGVRLRGATPEASEQFFTQLFDRLRTAPAIRDAGGSTYFPMSGNTSVAGIQLGDSMTNVLTNYATPGFFALMKVPIVAGRPFSSDDTRGSTPVVIVNQTLATRIRPDGQVLGQTIPMKSLSGPAAAAPVERTIVGILANTRSSGVHTRATSEAYVPYAQNPVISQQIVAEATPGHEGEAASQMRAAVRELRPDLVVAPPRSMEAMIRQRMGATP